ncbi:cysteine desulfurase [Aminipila sp.]|uniref:cysteine desulfurase n=1 Tax=Aminipila sp. TaxID=2060095 RepID=UPI00289A798E|nr:cysteine desulfurase [Aminipila sp.]
MKISNTEWLNNDTQIDNYLKGQNANDSISIKRIEQLANEFFPAFKTSAENSISIYEDNDKVFSEVLSQLNLLPEEWSLPDFRKASYDTELIRSDFPILSEKVGGKKLIWLDNAATTQKPKCVIDRLAYFYEHENSNVHRGAHTMAARATDAYEESRKKVRDFLNASSVAEVVFVRGATEAINLIAQTYGKTNIKEDDEVLISCLEHHANIVPWQILCSEKGAHLRVIPIDEDGQVDLEEYRRLLGPKTKIVSLAHVSNALGTIVPVKQMIKTAHQFGAKVVVDGAQAVSHLKVDVQELDADFYVFSGHKLYGPTGIGVLYGRLDILNGMIPYHGGGNMIHDVTFEKTQYQSAPHRFEAGTGNIADAVGLGIAIDYITQIGLDTIWSYEHSLLGYGEKQMKKVPGLKLIGNAKEKTSILSFVIQGINNEQIGQALNAEGIAVRAGHHCAQPVLRRLGLEGTVRPSLGLYNTKAEIDKMVEVLMGLQ